MHIKSDIAECEPARASGMGWFRSAKSMTYVFIAQQIMGVSCKIVKGYVRIVRHGLRSMSLFIVGDVAIKCGSYNIIYCM